MKSKADKLAEQSKAIEDAKMQGGVGPYQSSVKPNAEGLIVVVGMAVPAPAGRRHMVIEVGSDELCACHELLKAFVDNRITLSATNLKGLQELATHIVREFVVRPWTKRHCKKGVSSAVGHSCTNRLTGMW
jgi:hypothetical protein